MKTQRTRTGGAGRSRERDSPRTEECMEFAQRPGAHRAHSRGLAWPARCRSSVTMIGLDRGHNPDPR